VYSLLKVDFSPLSYLILLAIVRVVFPDMGWWSFFAVAITIHQFLLLFHSIGSVIPVRYLFGLFICIQMFIGPVLAYNGLDQYQFQMYRMQVTEAAYFAYAIPAVLLFILGLHFRAGKLKGEVVDLDGIKKFVANNPAIPYVFIAGGFITSILSTMVPSDLGFIFYLLGSFKFIGAFLLILGSERIKILPLIIVFGSIISSSLNDAMFHDLLIWIIFTGTVVALKVRPSLAIKVAVTVGFIILAVVIQQLKTGYRTARWMGREGNVSTFVDVYQEQSKKGIFTFSSLAPSSVRINQGFIVSYVLKTVPNVVPYSRGAELRQILEAAFLPRVLAPNKLVAGDRQLFNKYTGLQVGEGTSMGLGSISDAYLNFGIVGGCIFMFLLGLIYGEVLIAFQKFSYKIPIAVLFIALVFYHPIRPDNELQTVLGHLVKSCVLLWATYYFSKRRFNLEPSESPLPAPLR
jgi:hypothetical protein